MAEIASPAYWKLKLQALIIRPFAYLIRFYSIIRERQNLEIFFPTRSRATSIPSTKRAGDHIKIRIYDAPDETAGLRPVHINWHACGWVASGFGVDHEFCDYLRTQLNITVLDCDYIKAPETPFPGAYNDVVDVIAHVLSSQSKYDITNLTVGGFSSGATTALSVVGTSPLLRSADGTNLVKGVVGFYPSTDLSKLPPPPTPLPPGSTATLLNLTFVALFWGSYAWISGTDARDPRISPAYVDPARMPSSVCLIHGEHDNLRPEGDELAERLKEGGVKVERLILGGCGHGWDKSAIKGTWESARKDEAYAGVAEYLRGLYAA